VGGASRFSYGTEDHINVDEESERAPRERLDERLVLGSGLLYRQGIKIEKLGRQQDAVARYLDTVHEVLFGGVSVAALGDGRPSRSGSQGEVGAGGARQGPWSSAPFSGPDSAEHN